ncbi:ArsR/SmtB family transcription factor [Tetragenococcus muriaticus]|uniref:ArsR/SmtB family transcription factor n=1 Tax=Tetragenococcus muriaticus TaxID=64642 RepID=UPI00056F68A6|nr:metalloregulator ArsR/SmtB family transcription factor [Tetragenococcus muriaticus]
MHYELTAKVFKALGDPTRLQIVDMLSCGERCACDLLELFDFTQPTLSHHMKVLINAGIVKTRKVGTWHNYSLNESHMKALSTIVQDLRQNTDDCICNTIANKNCSVNNREKVKPNKDNTW